MRIELVDKKGEEIIGFDTESNPFAVGQVIHIDVSNGDKSYWTVEPMHKSFKILNIENYVRINYRPNKTVSQFVSTSIQV